MFKFQAQELFLAQGKKGVSAASMTWRKHFLRRYKLSIRRRTREGQTTPADAEQAAVAFGQMVREKMAELRVTKVFNTDQTGECLMNSDVHSDI
jgi:hypothetical protein